MLGIEPACQRPSLSACNNLQKAGAYLASHKHAQWACHVIGAVGVQLLLGLRLQQTIRQAGGGSCFVEPTRGGAVHVQTAQGAAWAVAESTEGHVRSPTSSCRRDPCFCHAAVTLKGFVTCGAPPHTLILPHMVSGSAFMRSHCTAAGARPRTMSRHCARIESRQEARTHRQNTHGVKQKADSRAQAKSKLAWWSWCYACLHHVSLVPVQ